MIILVMGVSGSGKTTVGSALARRLGAAFIDADDFHPPANVEKMRSGRPLTDEDRAGWLDRLNEVLRQREAAGESVVLACSALKRAYRRRLSAGLRDAARVIFLRADAATIRGRMEAREHFMPPSLLQSQLETLEEPEDAVTIDAAQPLEAVVAAAVAAAQDGRCGKS